ncbi:hypothetical protein M9458_051680 [Cirrhinus mrigala]|uniref:Retrotransposon gag domain-containing protein n=1 Tax=Cirrhinus mrigala TaxID=683832 RepID=A0ABD0MTU8_CIRMR
MFWAEEILMNIQQAERPLEQYVEEFLSVIHLRNLSTMSLLFVIPISMSMWKILIFPPSVNTRPLQLTTSVLHVLLQQAHSLQSSLTHPNSPELLPHPQPQTPAASSSRTPAAASSRTPTTAPCSSKPATAPRSGFMASNMASHIYHKNIMDQFGLLSPLSLLVPSSPPLSLLVPSRPPKSLLVPSSRPEPERPPERRPEPERPPERPLEPELPPEPQLFRLRAFGIRCARHVKPSLRR